MSWNVLGASRAGEQLSVSDLDVVRGKVGKIVVL